jgi:hypothetical protein
MGKTIKDFIEELKKFKVPEPKFEKGGQEVNQSNTDNTMRDMLKSQELKLDKLKEERAKEFMFLQFDELVPVHYRMYNPKGDLYGLLFRSSSGRWFNRYGDCYNDTDKEMATLLEQEWQARGMGRAKGPIGILHTGAGKPEFIPMTADNKRYSGDVGMPYVPDKPND